MRLAGWVQGRGGMIHATKISPPPQAKRATGNFATSIFIVVLLCFIRVKIIIHSVFVVPLPQCKVVTLESLQLLFLKMILLSYTS